MFTFKIRGLGRYKSLDLFIWNIAGVIRIHVIFFVSLKQICSFSVFVSIGKIFFRLF